MIIPSLFIFLIFLLLYALGVSGVQHCLQQVVSIYQPDTLIEALPEPDQLQRQVPE